MMLPDALLDRLAWFVHWMLSPGFTGFSRIAHFFWCVGGLLLYLVFLPLMVWFGYCCWTHDVQLVMVSGFALALCVLMSSATLVVSSKMMATESIIAKQNGRDLDF